MDEREREDLLYDAVFDELDEDGHARLEATLREDPQLRSELSELRELWNRFGDVIADDGSQPRPGQAPRRRSLFAAVTPAIAAAVVFFVLGHWWAGRSAEMPIEPTSRFAVLLYAGGGGGSGRPADEGFVRRVVQEHKDWAGELRSQGSHVLSEKLSTEPGVDLVVTNGSIEQRTETADIDGRRLGGVFVIQAEDLDQATRIARGCPLLNYGGVVRVRPIEPAPTPERETS